MSPRNLIIDSMLFLVVINRLGSMDRPPASRGTHKRLHSIEGDNWEEEPSRDMEGGKNRKDQRQLENAEATSSSALSSR
jgi:hypothetical protein